MNENDDRDSQWWLALPDGLHWATGGGNPLGDPGLHIAENGRVGSLCGRVTPEHTSASADSFVCGSCARIVASRNGLRVQTRFDRFTGRYANA